LLFFIAVEQRTNTRFFKLGRTPRETCEILHNVCGDEALSRSSVFDQFKRLTDGSEDLQDGPKCGRPSSSQNVDTKSTVHETVTRDRRWALRMMADELNINMETVSRTRTAFLASTLLI
jgi:hypothetical protein